MTRTYHHAEFDPARLVRAKAGRSVSVCLPAHNEASTIGSIVAAVRARLVEDCRLVDEVVVLDDRSTDDTAGVAAAAGARVARAEDVLPEVGPGAGKGEALWKSLHVADGDLIVWCDADISNFDVRFVVGLVAPLLVHPDLAFSKGFYERPLVADEGGGRVTELVARPLVALLHPHLGSIVQPLSGEYAGRREVLEELPFVQGYGVDLGLLIDVTARNGCDSVAQVDLGTRVHRNRSLAELGPMALAVMQTAFAKAGLPFDSCLRASLVRPGRETLEVAYRERPPLVELDAYATRHDRFASRERTA